MITNTSNLLKLYKTYVDNAHYGFEQFALKESTSSHAVSYLNCIKLTMTLQGKHNLINKNYFDSCLACLLELADKSNDFVLLASLADIINLANKDDCQQLREAFKTKIISRKINDSLLSHKLDIE